MQTYKAWYNANSTLHKALIVADGVAYVGSPLPTQLETIQELISRNESPLSIMGQKPSRLTRAEIREVQSESPGFDLTLHYQVDGNRRFTMVTFADAASRDEAISCLERELGLAKDVKRHSAFSAAIRPLVFLSILGFILFIK